MAANTHRLHIWYEIKGDVELKKAAWFSWEPALAKPALSHLNLPYFWEALEGSLACFLISARIFYLVRPERPQETRQRRRLRRLNSCVQTVPAGADSNVGGTLLFVVVVVCNASKRHLSSKVCQTTSREDWKTLFPTVVEACVTTAHLLNHTRRYATTFFREKQNGLGMKKKWRQLGGRKDESEKKTERHRAAVLFSPVNPQSFYAFPQGAHFLNTHTFSSAVLTPIGFKRKILSNRSMFG